LLDDLKEKTGLVVPDLASAEEDKYKMANVRLRSCPSILVNGNGKLYCNSCTAVDIKIIVIAAFAVHNRNYSGIRQATISSRIGFPND